MKLWSHHFARATPEKIHKFISKLSNFQSATSTSNNVIKDQPYPDFQNELLLTKPITSHLQHGQNEIKDSQNKHFCSTVPGNNNDKLTRVLKLTFRISSGFSYVVTQPVYHYQRNLLWSWSLFRSNNITMKLHVQFTLAHMLEIKKLQPIYN